MLELGGDEDGECRVGSTGWGRSGCCGLVARSSDELGVEFVVVRGRVGGGRGGDGDWCGVAVGFGWRGGKGGGVGWVRGGSGFVVFVVGAEGDYVGLASCVSLACAR